MSLLNLDAIEIFHRGLLKQKLKMLKGLMFKETKNI